MPHSNRSWNMPTQGAHKPWLAGTRFEALPAGTDCDVCVSHFSFCFSSAVELLWRYTTPPFLKYSFRRIMLQLDFRESKCKCEGSHLEQSQRHTEGLHAVCMRGDDLIYRHLPFKKLGFFVVQLWPLFFSSTFSDEQCSNLSSDDPNPMNRTQNSPKRRHKTAFCSSETLKSYAGDWPTVTGCPISNPDNNCANGLLRTARGHCLQERKDKSKSKDSLTIDQDAIIFAIAKQTFPHTFARLSMQNQFCVRSAMPTYAISYVFLFYIQQNLSIASVPKLFQM